jgi:hypothetical protein
LSFSEKTEKTDKTSDSVSVSSAPGKHFIFRFANCDFLNFTQKS